MHTRIAGEETRLQHNKTVMFKFVHDSQYISNATFNQNRRSQVADQESATFSQLVYLCRIRGFHYVSVLHAEGETAY